MRKASALLAGFDGQLALLQARFTSLEHYIEDALVEIVKPDLTARYASTVALAFGRSDMEERKQFPFSQGLAFIPITGVLLNRFPYACSFATGYNAIRGMLNAALEDPDVKGIVFDVNSPGGMVQGCFELADEIYASRTRKPSMAVVDGNCYSAAYALSSSAKRLVSVKSAGIGSIGVVMTHFDISKMLEQMGVKVTQVFAGDHKVDGNEFEPLPAAVKKDLQKHVNAIYGQFVELVATNRKIDASAVRGTEAQCYSAEEAKGLDLIDAIVSPTEAITAFAKDVSTTITSFPTGAKVMNPTEQAAADKAAADAKAVADADAAKAAADVTAKAVADARKADRERISAITGCEEAKGRAKLATHLAMNTEMSVADAKAALAAAATEVASAAPVKATNAFVAAMERTGNPEITAEGEPTKVDRADSMIKNFVAATGHRIN